MAEVKGVSKNHTLNNVVASFLQAYPSHQRPQEELDDMDAHCSITNDMLQKGQLYGLGGWDQGGGGDEDEEDDEEDEYGSEDEEEEAFDPRFNTRCRSCKHVVNGFQCVPNQHHLYCSVCGLPFPDRPADPPIQVRCEFCNRISCDPYWGCGAFAGKNFLRKLQEHEFATIPPSSLMNNQAEVKYAMDILAFNHLPGVNGLWQDIIDCIQQNKITQPATFQKPIKLHMIACRNCAQSIFENSIYKWRASLPPEKVPPLVSSRPDCFYGKNCRTQLHKIDHATKYNHVCEQTKF